MEVSLDYLVHVIGSPSVHYQSGETPMIMYLNAHSAIDQLRTKYEANGRIGPKVGDTNCFM